MVAEAQSNVTTVGGRWLKEDREAAAVGLLALVFDFQDVAPAAVPADAQGRSGYLVPA